MVEKIKNKLNKLHQRKIFLEDFVNGKKYWLNETNGLSLHQHVIKIDIEISILEEILES